MAVVAVILFVPIRRYAYFGSFPIELEPYRLLVGLTLAAWIAALLVDDRVRIRRSGFEGPLLTVAIAVFGSIILNPSSVSVASDNVIKSTIFFSSFILFFYFVVSVVRTHNDLETVMRTLVIGSTVLAASAVIEFRTGFSIFSHLDKLPFVDVTDFPIEKPRGGRIRAYASAEHPIALGALFVVILPFAIYYTNRFGRWWWLPTLILPMGVMATLSRTGAIMLIAVLVVYAVYRPRSVRRMIPLLVVFVIALKLVVPGALGTLRYQFFPQGGLVANQQTSAGDVQSGNRLTDVGPVLSSVARKPLFGIGYASRVRGAEIKTGRILDDQWLGALYDTGIVGFIGWLWLVCRFCRRVGGSVGDDGSPDAWLRIALVASVVSYAIGMATFDAFSFSQVTFVFYLVLALGAVVSLRDAVIPGPSPPRGVSASP